MKKLGLGFIHGVFYFFLALLFGITLARGLYSGELKSLLIALVCIALVSAFLLWKKKWKFLLILLAFFFAGNGLFFAGTAVWGGEDYDQPVAVVGRVDDQVYDYGTTQVVILKDVTINGKSVRNVKVTIFNNGEEGVKSGEEISFVSEVSQSGLFELGNFNTYYFRNNIGYTTSVSINNVVAVESFLKLDEKYRLHVKDQLEKGMSEDYASVCYAVLFGDKQDVPSEIKNAYSDSGIVHILVVSGLHVGFLIACLYFILNKYKLNKWISFAIAFIFLLVYCYLCGFSPSVVRASVMAIVVLLARLCGRRYDRLTSLGLAGFIIVLSSPLTALDVGFLMSFFCVATIFFVYPVLADLLAKIFPRKAAELIAMSISAQLGILPFVSLFSESYNLLSVFANIIVLPLFSIMFPLLFVMMILASIMTFISPAFVLFEWIMTFITHIALFFSSTSFRVPLSSFGVEIVVAFYVILFACSRYLMSSKLVKGVVVSCGLFAIALAIVLNSIPSKFSGVDVLSDYSTQVVVVTSESGQRLVLGSLNDSSYNKYVDRVNSYGIDYFVSDNALTSSTLDFITSQNCQMAILSDTAMSTRKDIIEAEENREYTLGDFRVKYIKSQGIFIGIEIYYSSHSIFFASSSKMSYNNIEIAKSYIAGQDFSLAVLGVNDSLAESFSNATIVSRKGAEGYSYTRDGNIRLSWNESGWQARGLD